MANFNPLTNAVGGAGATTPNVYYNTPPTNFGEYQFVKLTEVVDNFMAAYVGEGKILANVLMGDVNFHAHRALQELSYDTLKSCKSLEIEVCPSLKMPLPHDYVNYVKITSVDGNGVEHIIYPTRHTSHPFAIEQDDCAYVFEGGELKHQETCTDGATTTCDPTVLNGFLTYTRSNMNSLTQSAFAPFTHDFGAGDVTFTSLDDFISAFEQELDSHCACLSTNPNKKDENCGVCIKKGGANQTFMSLNADKKISTCWNDLPENIDSSSGTFSTVSFTSIGDCELTSNTWTNHSNSGGGNSIGTGGGSDPSVDNSNYFQNSGERYGLQPEHAQVNGSFFIDCARGNIHFGSNFSGKTVILHYISDHHGTDDEQIVHKFAEEAMYKWIAYGCLSARIDTPEYVIQRFKKEKFAETRKAKIRLSNIKIEEIAQIMRNKSKWINH
jgi:hypothetical protein